jgi:CheY-like chemotaxis protein
MAARSVVGGRNDVTSFGRRLGAAKPAAVRVLLVEDDRDTREATHELLRLAGFAVRSAESVKDALTLFRERTPDVVVADLNMPVDDGYDLMRSLAPTRVPVIAFTALATDEDKRRVRQAGFALHLAKPVDPAEMITAVTIIAASNPRRDRSAKTAKVRLLRPRPE